MARVHTDPEQLEAVLVTGGLASGKTSVAIEIGELLEQARIPFAVVDLDWLCWAWSPSLAADGVHTLMCDNLRALLPNLREQGIRRLVLARAVLSTSGMAQLQESVAPTPLRVVRLTATEEHAVARLRARDSGQRLAAHLARRAAFADLVTAAAADTPVVDTSDRAAADVAAEIVASLGWARAGQ